MLLIDIQARCDATGKIKK